MFKKTTICLLLALFTKLSYSQSNLYSDSVRISESTILIATSDQFKQFEFCVEKSNDIIKELKKLTYGKEQEYPSKKSPVVIKLVTKGKITKIWSVYPASSLIVVEGRKFSFDTSILSILHNKFPVKYSVEEKVFESQNEQEEYYLNLLNDKDFLYIVPHDFEKVWKERFELTFKKNGIFSSPLAISTYLDSILTKIVPREKYSISYGPFDDAKNDSPNELTMTIYSMYDLYSNFNDVNATKSGLTFYPTYIIRKE